MNAPSEVAALVRRQDPDRFFADLFVPAERRQHLFALHAFNAEVARIRETVSDPMPGEIRLQWWRDALRSGETGGHPVAAALMTAIATCRLPVPALERLLEARIFDLYDDPMPDMGAFEAYAGDTASSLFQLAAIILAGGQDPGTADAAGHAGVAYALTGLMRALPIHARRGQIYLPVDRLKAAGGEPGDLLAGNMTAGLRAGLAGLRATARGHLAAAMDAAEGLAPEIAVAFLPLALVGPYLARMERPGVELLGRAVDLPQWRRQWTLWRAAKKRGGPGG